MPSDLPSLLARFHAHLASQFPAVVQSLRPGASTSDLDAFEREHGMILPEAFRQLYLWHDGQDFAAPKLFGSLQFWSLAEVRKYMAEWRDDPLLMADFSEEDDDDYPSYPPGHIRTSYLRLGWIAFADSPAAQSLCFDLDPGQLGTYGQIIGWSSDDHSRYVLADSFEGFLEALLTRFDEDKVCLIGEGLNSYKYLSFNGSVEDESGIFPEFAGIGTIPVMYK